MIPMSTRSRRAGGGRRSTLPPTRSSKSPHDTDFHARTLDHLPAAVLVVRADGTIAYANRALTELVGWGVEDGIAMQMLDVVHPDDRAWLIDAFASVANSPVDRHSVDAPAWSPVRVRVITKDGSVMPVEVTGGGGLHDPSVDGVVYSVRPCRDDELLAEVFRGMATNQPIESAAGPLVERLLQPPLNMHAVLFEQSANGTARCVVATH
jgi:PAS domain S-box-containing protein